jgi:2,3-bisphosphoglycerate-dependent phosphoglycerate mutase
MRIVFVRHGQDERGYRGGWSQRGLVPEGHAQAVALAETLRERWQPLKHLISSDLPRAAETAAPIATALGLAVHDDPAWRETNNGELAGMHNDEASVRYPGLYFASLAMDEPYPGGESPRQNFERIAATFRRLCKQIEAGALPDNVLVVTHGGVINIVYHLLHGKEWNNKNSSFPAATASIHEITRRSNGWCVTQANVVDHRL